MVSPDIMRALARELLDGDPAGHRLLVMSVRVDRDRCGCVQLQVAHAAALTDDTDAAAARMLLRREYDRRAARPLTSLLTELELS